MENIFRSRWIYASHSCLKYFFYFLYRAPTSDCWKTNQAVIINGLISPMNFYQIRADKKMNLSKMPTQDDSLVGRNLKNHVDSFC
jgi:hypothetical protein